MSEQPDETDTTIVYLKKANYLNFIKENKVILNFKLCLVGLIFDQCLQGVQAWFNRFVCIVDKKYIKWNCLLCANAFYLWWTPYRRNTYWKYVYINIQINELKDVVVSLQQHVTPRHRIVVVADGTLLSKLLQFSVELSFIWNYGHINDAVKIENEEDILFTQKDTTAAHTIHNSMNPNKNSISPLPNFTFYVQHRRPTRLYAYNNAPLRG